MRPVRDQRRANFAIKARPIAKSSATLASPPTWPMSQPSFAGAAEVEVEAEAEADGLIGIREG